MIERKSTNVDQVFERDLKKACEHRKKRFSERYDETSPPETRHEKFVNMFCKSWIYLSCIIVRIIFLAFLSFGIHFLRCVYDNRAFIIIYISPIVIILEGCYVIIKRKGYDPYW